MCTRSAKTARKAGTTSVTGKPPPLQGSSTRGVALIEALIASVMAAIGITGALAAILAAVHTATVANERLQALFRLEGELVTVGGDAAVAGGVDSETRQGTWAEIPSATWQVAITTESDYLMTVAAQATWLRGGQPRTLSLTTYAPPVPEADS